MTQIDRETNEKANEDCALKGFGNEFITSGIADKIVFNDSIFWNFKQPKSHPKCECGQTISKDDIIFNRSLCIECRSQQTKLRQIAKPISKTTGRTIRIYPCLSCGKTFSSENVTKNRCQKCGQDAPLVHRMAEVFSEFLGGANAAK